MKKILSEFAKKKGWSLPVFAEKIGSPYPTVYGYDRGDRKMPPEFVSRAAELLGVDPGKILQNYAEKEEFQREEKAQIYAADLLQFLSNELIEQIIHELARRLPGAENGVMRSLMAALQAISEEKERRKTAADDPPSSDLSAPDIEGIAESEGTRVAEQLAQEKPAASRPSERRFAPERTVAKKTSSEPSGRALAHPKKHDS